MRNYMVLKMTDEKGNWYAELVKEMRRRDEYDRSEYVEYVDIFNAETAEELKQNVSESDFLGSLTSLADCMYDETVAVKAMFYDSEDDTLRFALIIEDRDKLCTDPDYYYIKDYTTK